MGLMRDQDAVETKPAETRNESAQKTEPKKRDEKRRTFDTLSEDNPFICRGID